MNSTNKTTTASHTPGPWHTGGINPISAPVIYAADGFAVADATVYHRHHDGQTAANARLIAAAPDLLASLRDVLALHLAHHNNPVHVAARAAIAKAEGRS